MPRRLRKTFSGRQEEVWETKDGGLFGAYDLKEWYLNLPEGTRSRILALHHEDEAKSSLMMKWNKAQMTSGPMEIHRPILDRWSWQYSTVPHLLLELFDLVKKRDDEIAQLVLDEWLHRAKKTRSAGAKYLALTAAVEFYWSRGYTNAKAVREQGLHNEDLLLIEKHALEMVDLLKKQQLPQDLDQCKPLDRLRLLYKLLGKDETIKNLADLVYQAGYTRI